jgi:hypothetical protein
LKFPYRPANKLPLSFLFGAEWRDQTRTVEHHDSSDCTTGIASGSQCWIISAYLRSTGG